MVDPHDGFDDWYRSSHRRLVASMIALAGGNRDLAVEVTDEAFARAWLHWARVESMASSQGWLFRVAVHLLRRRQQRATLERTLLLKFGRPTPKTDRVDEISDAIAALPARQRAVIVLRYVADLPEAEIAQVLGVGRSTVSSTLTTAHRRLALAWAEPGLEVTSD
jgi:RNA polymerase sigma factor (sigma-70 family)